MKEKKKIDSKVSLKYNDLFKICKTDILLQLYKLIRKELYKRGVFK